MVLAFIRFFVTFGIVITKLKTAGDRLVLSPHLGGITEAAFRRCHFHMWRNAERVADGHKPDNIVNGLE